MAHRLRHVHRQALGARGRAQAQQQAKLRERDKKDETAN
jgi:hypothetical protein